MWQPVPERRDLPATSRAPSDLVLAFTRVLHVNGESTDDTLAAADRLANHFGLRASILPRWGELQIESADDGLVPWLRPIPPASTWIAWRQPCGPSTSSPPAG